jgi:NAD(P)-dependent dehydrogenase (short-subunit alcohol dehydrogenase family)
METLSGRTALVTGSTNGVGRLVARKLGQAGARVLVHGRDAERGIRVVADIEATGGAATFLAADLSALAEVRRLADEARAAVDRLDILINNAGIGTAKSSVARARGQAVAYRGSSSCSDLMPRCVVVTAWSVLRSASEAWPRRRTASSGSFTLAATA